MDAQSWLTSILTLSLQLLWSEGSIAGGDHRQLVISKRNGIFRVGVRDRSLRGIIRFFFGELIGICRAIIGESLLHQAMTTSLKS